MHWYALSDILCLSNRKGESKRWEQGFVHGGSKLKRYRVTILVMAIILIVAIALIIVEYNINGAGFNGYTITDDIEN